MSVIEQLTGVQSKARDPERFRLSLEDRLDLELNDAGNARRILAHFGADMIYVLGKGWGLWDGNRYSFASGSLKAAEIAASLPDLLREEIGAAKEKTFDDLTIARAERDHPQLCEKAGGATNYLRSEIIKKLTGHAIRCGNVDKQAKALKACEWQVRAEIQDLDADPWSLVVRNGVVNLRRAKDAGPLGLDGSPPDLAEWRADWLRPPDRTFLPTKCADVPFIPGAVCPEWETFIALIVPDELVRRCIQRALGAVLFGENVAQVALLLRGGGGNGKSTLMKMIGEVLGTFDGYAAPCKVEMFLQTQNQSAAQATPEEVDLPGARCIIASEPAVTDVFSAKKIKAMTGGDLRAARALNMPQFIYRPTAIPVIQFNRTPRIKDEDEGTRRRMVFIPLEVNLRALPPEMQKSTLEAEAILRPELPGILNWMLDGFRDFFARLDAGKGTPPGIDPPEAMLSLKERIMEAADPVGTFLKECADIEPNKRCRTAEFFRAFKAWAKDTGARQFSDAALRDNLTEKGFEKGKSNGFMVFKGFGLKDDPLVQRYLDDPAGYRGGPSEDDFKG